MFLQLFTKVKSYKNKAFRQDNTPHIYYCSKNNFNSQGVNERFAQFFASLKLIPKRKNWFFASSLNFSLEIKSEILSPLEKVIDALLAYL